MIKACVLCTPYGFRVADLFQRTDMEYEEERGCGSQEEAKDQRCTDTGTERCVSRLTISRMPITDTRALSLQT